MAKKKKVKKVIKRGKEEKREEPWWKNVTIGRLAHPSNIYGQHDK